MQTAFRSEARFTQAEFRKWLRTRPPAEVGRYELLGGRIVMSPPAGWVHGALGIALARRLAEHIGESRLGYAFDSSTGYELPSGDTVEPDFSFISMRRFAAGPKPAGDQFLRIVPDLVVEMLSSSTARRDRTEKKAIYARSGVDEYWLVDASRREVTVLYREGQVFGARRVVSRGAVISRALPALELDVGELFSDLPPG